MEHATHVQHSCVQIPLEVSRPYAKVNTKREPLLNDEEDLLEELYRVDPTLVYSSNNSKTNKLSQTTLPNSKINSLPRKAKPSSPAYCALCLRGYQRKLFVEFTRGIHESRFDAVESEKKLSKAVDLNLNLTHHIICRACWALVETITEFVECCLRARKRADKFPNGISNDYGKDDWLSSEIIESIERIHVAIQVHTGRIDLEELAKETPDENVDRIKVESHPYSEDSIETENSDSDQLSSEQDHRLSTESSDSSSTESESVLKKVEIIRCKICLKRFKTKLGHSKHISRCKSSPKRNVNEDSLACSFCSASFETQSLLQYHLNRHKGIKPYKCRRECKSSFYSPRIRRTHEDNCEKGGRVCDICGAVLKTKQQLSAHKNALHEEVKLIIQ